MEDKEKRLKDIREWLIENIFRDGYVMFSDAREVGQIDLIDRCKNTVITCRILWRQFLEGEYEI